MLFNYKTLLKYLPPLLLFLYCKLVLLGNKKLLNLILSKGHPKIVLIKGLKKRKLF